MRKEPIFLWGVYWIVQLLTFSVHLIPFQIDASQDGARNTVPCTADGAGQDGKWLGSKEVSAYGSPFGGFGYDPFGGYQQRRASADQGDQYQTSAEQYIRFHRWL